MRAFLIKSFHKLVEKLMRNGGCFFSYSFEVWVDIFVIKSIVIVLYLTTHSHPVRSQKFTQVMFCSFWYLVNEQLFPMLTVSYELTDRYAELFDEGQVCYESLGLEMGRVVHAERFVWFLKWWTPW